jgi:hypothetical protein
MNLPIISITHDADDFGIKLHLPSRVTDDLPEVWISRPSEGRINVLVFNGADLVADIFIDD